jgi:hypothetical protein
MVAFLAAPFGNVAHASISITLDPNPTNFSKFDYLNLLTPNAPAPAFFTAGGYSFYGNGNIGSGYTVGVSAPPFGNSFNDNYLFVKSGQTETILTGLTHSFTIALSTIDAANTLYLGSDSLTGSQIRAGIRGLAYGLVTFHDTNVFNSVTMTSGITSFEALPQDYVSGVPEPSTWAMLVLGFAGLGLAARRKARSLRLAMID